MRLRKQQMIPISQVCSKACEHKKCIENVFRHGHLMIWLVDMEDGVIFPIFIHLACFPDSDQQMAHKPRTHTVFLGNFFYVM